MCLLLSRQLCLLFVVAAASAAPQFIDQGGLLGPNVRLGQPEVRIVSQKFDQDQVGNYEYAYEQSDSQKVTILRRDVLVSMEGKWTWDPFCMRVW